MRSQHNRQFQFQLVGRMVQSKPTKDSHSAKIVGHENALVAQGYSSGILDKNMNKEKGRKEEKVKNYFLHY